MSEPDRSIVMAKIFRVGDLDLTCVDDGILKSSVDFVLGMDREEASKISGATDDGSIFIPVNNFMLQRDGATILIDAGAGNTMQPTLGRLPENMTAAGVDPAAVTHILLTHLHPDHANGLVDDNHEAIFTGAEIVVHEVEFNFWMREGDPGESDALKRTRARNKINMKPYLDRVRLMRDGQDLKGCSPILAPGHSPGHTCWRIETGREALIAWGDLVHFSAIQIPHPQSAVKYDLDGDRARASRLRMLDMIATEHLAIAGAHVNAPGVGYLSKTDTGYRFEPA
jgi:glyoxylase-like metal-dependent hydrolase (beta-lactamase superfamily II)